MYMYISIFFRSTSSMERGGGGAGQGRGEGGEGGRAESSNTRQLAPRYHGNRVGTGEGVEPGDKGIGDRKTHPWPAMGVLEWAQSGEVCVWAQSGEVCCAFLSGCSVCVVHVRP